MPIAAPVAAGLIAGAGAIGGAVIGSSAQKKAAKQASQAQQDSTQAQLQLGRESMALNKDIYNSNYALLSPFVSNGLVASNSLNALLGLPAAPQMTSPLAQPGGGTYSGGGQVPNPANGLPAQGGPPGANPFGNPYLNQIFF